MPSPVAEQLVYLAESDDRARTITLKRQTGGTYDPQSDSYSNTTPETCTPRAFVFEYSQELIAAGAVELSDRKFQIVNDDRLTFTPATGQIITDAGVEYTLQEVGEDGSGAETWSYTGRGTRS